MMISKLVYSMKSFIQSRDTKEFSNFLWKCLSFGIMNIKSIMYTKYKLTNT